MLVDCGPDQSVLGQLGKRVSFFDRRIDYLLVTHFDADHYAGCVEVLRRYQVGRVLTNGDIKPNDALWQAWNEAVRAEGSQVATVRRGDMFQIGNSTSTFLWPDPNHQLRPTDNATNNRSLVFVLEQARTRYVFTGDIEEPVEQELVSLACASSETCPELRGDVLKAPHHGSDTSSSQAFLRAVRPSKVIVSVGKHNTFGHPSLRVIRRYEQADMVILRTDRQGAILLP